MQKCVMVAIILLSFFTSLSANTDIVLKDIKSYETSLALDDNTAFDNKLFKTSKNIFKVDSKSSVLIKLELFNSLSKEIEREIIFTSATIDTLKVYLKDNNKTTLLKDLSYGVREARYLYPSITIKLKAKVAKKLYALVGTKYKRAHFSIKVEDRENLLKDNSKKILLYTFIVGLLVALATVFILLYLFSSEISYIYFAILLVISLLIHIYLSGLELVYFSKSFTLLDRTLITIKFNLLFILSSLQAVSFYKIDKGSRVYNSHMLFIFIATACTIIAGFADISYFMPPMFIIFILLNIATALIYISKGIIEAFLYLVVYTLAGWIVAVKIYFADLLDTLNSYHFIILLAIYVLMALSYLFKYIEQRRRANKMLNSTLEQKAIVDSQIEQAEATLDKLKKSEDGLKDRMNIVIKNNLHLILSMLKKKSESNLEITQEIERLGIRVSVVVRIYSLFLAVKDVNRVDMREYLPIVLNYIESKHSECVKRVDVVARVDAVVTQNEAIDIAVTLADIIMSSYEDGTYMDNELSVTLKAIDGSYNLSVKDTSSTKRVLSDKLKILFTA